MAQSNAVQKVAPAELPAKIQKEIDEDFKEMLSEGGFEFPQIGIAHQNQLFDMPIGDPKKTFTGVLLREQRFNLYWEKKASDDEEKVPPTCSSQDAKTGTKFGDCASCEFNQFGSGKDDHGNPTKGKACNSKSALMIWPTEIETSLPLVLTISPTSLSGRHDRSQAGVKIRSYGASQRVPETAIVATFKLNKVPGPGEQVYSVLDVDIVGSVRDGAMTPEEYVEFRELSKRFSSDLKEKTVEMELAEPQTGDGEQRMETEAEPDFKPEDIEPGDTVSTMSNEEADNLFKEKTNPKGGKDGLPF